MGQLQKRGCMRFEELKKEVKSCAFDEVRLDNSDFFEAVIQKKNLEILYAKLNSIFGAPAWPSENKLSEEMQSVIKAHGGIMSGQTLYFAMMENFPVFVMFWPWGDKEHVTVKLGRKNE